MADTKFGFTTRDGRDWADELEGMIRDGERTGEQLRLLKHGDALLKERDPLLERKTELEAAGKSGFQIKPADSNEQIAQAIVEALPHDRAANIVTACLALLRVEASAVQNEPNLVEEIRKAMIEMAQQDNE
jgi:hypothetical protein